jgi:large subunit ribosomal protein L24
MMRIKSGDMVVVTNGDDASATPHKVISVLDGGKKLVIEGVNRVFKHVKRNHPKSPQGGRLSMEKPIDSSNCLYFCAACAKGVRLGYRYTSEGRKERFCKKCDASAGVISPPRPRYATKAS